MGKKTTKLRKEIEPRLFNVDQTRAYLGHNIGRDLVIKLMKNNVIDTVETGGRDILLTTRDRLDDFIERMFATPIETENFNSMPLKHYRTLIEEKFGEINS